VWTVRLQSEPVIFFTFPIAAVKLAHVFKTQHSCSDKMKNI